MRNSPLRLLRRAFLICAIFGLCLASLYALALRLQRRVDPAMVGFPAPARDITRIPASTQRVELSSPGVPRELIEADLRRFAGLSTNTAQSRREYCATLLREAGYAAHIDPGGDVWAWKQGSSANVVLIGAHSDKVDGPSQGILDDMIGCVLTARTMHALRERSTRYSYLVVLYADEEGGRTIGQAAHPKGAPSDTAPAFIISVDYVGDIRSELLGRWLTPDERSGEPGQGIMLTSYPQPSPPTTHSDRDNLASVDFAQAYLAYETILFLVEGIERGDGLRPPPTARFWDVTTQPSAPPTR